MQSSCFLLQAFGRPVPFRTQDDEGNHSFVVISSFIKQFNASQQQAALMAIMRGVGSEHHILSLAVAIGRLDFFNNFPLSVNNVSTPWRSVTFSLYLSVLMTGDDRSLTLHRLFEGCYAFL